MTTIALHPEPVYRMFAPPWSGPAPAILVLGGGDGGIGYATSVASRLAPQGYNVMALAYFGSRGLSKRLVEIELRYFEDALARLAADPRTLSGGKIGVFAISKGVGAALWLAGGHPEIGAIAAAGPSDVYWESPHHKDPQSRNRSSWTLDGVAPSSRSITCRARPRSHATRRASPAPTPARIAASPSNASRLRC